MARSLYVVTQAWGGTTEPVGVDAVPFTSREEAKECFDLYVEDYCRANEIDVKDLNILSDNSMRHFMNGEDTLITIIPEEI